MGAFENRLAKRGNITFVYWSTIIQSIASVLVVNHTLACAIFYIGAEPYTYTVMFFSRFNDLLRQTGSTVGDAELVGHIWHPGLLRSFSVHAPGQQNQYHSGVSFDGYHLQARAIDWHKQHTVNPSRAVLFYFAGLFDFSSFLSTSYQDVLQLGDCAVHPCAVPL